MKILIVDDSAPMRRLIRTYLDGLAPSVFECSDGSEALQLFSQHRPDWVLMDIQMKVVDGFTATSQIMDKYPEARVVMVSQHDSRALRNEARNVGACGYITKSDLSELKKLFV